MLLRLSKIKRHFFSSESGEKREVLKGISFDVEAGRSYAIVGPSGSGKSTLLHIMGLLDNPSAGKLIFNGKSTASLSERERAALRNREIGFVFQLHYLLPQFTVLENVLLPVIPGRGRDFSRSQERARLLLERVGLADFLGSKPGQLSGGERQRVAFVRALINTPSLLLADEPTGSLDRATAIGIARLMASLNAEEHTALVVVTHSKEVARTMNKVLRLDDGVLIPEKKGS
jgi:ABC-type lipoprotein export system ATPase subunit